jgi:hypothetical protein
MKYLVLFLTIITISSCDESSKEIVISDRCKEWKVEVIEGHEFLYRNADRSVAYIHRPNCKSCKLK